MLLLGDRIMSSCGWSFQGRQHIGDHAAVGTTDKNLRHGCNLKILMRHRNSLSYMYLIPSDWQLESTLTRNLSRGASISTDSLSQPLSELIITITTSSNLIGALTALFFTNYCVWLKSDSFISQSYKCTQLNPPITEFITITIVKLLQHGNVFNCEKRHQRLLK